MKRYDFCVIGGGLVGMGTARALQEKHPRASVLVLEKEAGPGQHQSTHNSGVLHAGLYYKPGSLKARLAVQGIRQMTRYCESKGISHEICGKLVIATTEEEITRLRELFERGKANGLQGLAWLEQEQLKDREPHASGLAGVLVPEEGIVDYAAVCSALMDDIIEAGGTFSTQSRVFNLLESAEGWVIGTTQGDFSARYLINCAGLFCDKVAKLAGVKESVQIVPFRGEYFHLTAEASKLVRHLIYPVPDPAFPFLGVHFTRLIHGGIEAGPNAVLATAREGYRKTDLKMGEFLEALTFPGLWKFLRRYPSMCWDEIIRSCNKTIFAASLQKLIPEVQAEHLLPGGAGVRAQAMMADGTLVQDFWLKEQSRALHVLNAPSPAATASLAIGRHLVETLSESQKT